MTPPGQAMHLVVRRSSALTSRSVVRNHYGFVGASSPAVSNVSVSYYAGQVAVRATASGAAEEKTERGKKKVWCVCV